MRCAAIVPSAGIGTRFGAAKNKPFHLLMGKPLVVWALQTLDASEAVSEIVPVVKPDDVALMMELAGEFHIRKVSRVVTGGAERQDSVRNGIGSLKDDYNVILIQDGARPFLSAGMINECLAALISHDGAVTAVPVKDTIKESADSSGTGTLCIVEKTLDRGKLWAVQTPQAFRSDILRLAYERAFRDGYYGTDDAALVERIGGRIRIVPGSYGNIKVTTPEDIIIAEALIRCASA